MTGDRSVLSTLGPMLPLSVAGILMRGVGRAAERAGCTQVAIGGGLQISGVLPEPGARPQEHLIDVGLSGFHQGMVAWACTCCESSDGSFSDVGRAVADAIGHVPDGAHWSVEPVDRLIGGSTAERAAAGGAAAPAGVSSRVSGLNEPMVRRLRECAADASSEWDGKVTVYPHEARGLVALIEASAEAEELRALFAAQQERMREATARWCAEDPEARAMVLPDLGDLLRWLMDDADQARGGTPVLESPAVPAEQARLSGLTVGEGFTELQVSVARDTAVRLVDAAKTFLTSTGAQNYVEHQVHDPQTGERYTLTIQRPGRKTPHDLRLAAESDLDQRLAQVNRVVTALNRWQRRREDTPDGSGFSEFYDQVLAAVDVVGEPEAEDTSPSPSNGAT